MAYYIHFLPREILIEVMVFLEKADLFLFNCVCKLWSTLYHDEGVKKKFYFIDMRRLGIIAPVETHHLFNLVYLRSFNDLYPGIQEFLDLYHCLARAIKKLHHPAVKYFVSKAVYNTLDVSEFATLFDFLADHWHPGIFRALVKKYLLLFRQHWHVSLFDKLKKEDYEPCLVGFPKPLVTERGANCIARAPYSEIGDLLVTGRKKYLEGKKNRDFTAEDKKKYSLEIRNLIECLE